jgi:hypothetical protein
MGYLNNTQENKTKLTYTLLLGSKYVLDANTANSAPADALKPIFLGYYRNDKDL